MKVLLVNASPRREGNTYRALCEVSRQLENRGVESEIVQLGVKPVRSCIACNQCLEKELGRCVFDDDMCNRVSEKMAECDGFIIGSPVYYGQPTGAALSLVQRMFYSAGHLFQNKPAASIAVCRRGGATAALQTLMMPFQLKNMPLVTSQYWNIVYGLNKGEAKLDVEGMQTMRQLARNMAWLLKNNAQVPAEEEWQPMHFIR